MHAMRSTAPATLLAFALYSSTLSSAIATELHLKVKDISKNSAEFHWKKESSIKEHGIVKVNLILKAR